MILVSIHHSILRALHQRDFDNKIISFLRELVCFGYKEATCCIFPAFIFGMLALTRVFEPVIIPRYDLLLIACLIMQWLMVKVGLETKEELLIICIFHFLGICMEVHKVSHGSWSYPAEGYTKVFGVPLYSGFMYASVASYVCQAWSRMNLTYKNWPPLWQQGILAAGIYGNFFTNAYVQDIRIFLFILLLIFFGKTVVYYTTNGPRRAMPMVMAFVLIAFFIWFAENIGTSLGAWRYPHQHKGWSFVKVNIMSSWFLLVIVSVILVAILKRVHVERLLDE